MPQDPRDILAWLESEQPPREVGRDGLALTYAELREENRRLWAIAHRARAVAVQLAARWARERPGRP